MRDGSKDPIHLEKKKIIHFLKPKPYTFDIFSKGYARHGLSSIYGLQLGDRAWCSLENLGRRSTTVMLRTSTAKEWASIACEIIPLIDDYHSLTQSCCNPNFCCALPENDVGELHEGHTTSDVHVKVTLQLTGRLPVHPHTPAIHSLYRVLKIISEA